MHVPGQLSHQLNKSNTPFPDLTVMVYWAVSWRERVVFWWDDQIKLKQRSKSLRVDMFLHLNTLSWVNQSDVLILVEKQQILSFLKDPTGYRSALEMNTLSIKPHKMSYTVYDW